MPSSGGEPFLTQDEESSGIIDVTDILGFAGQTVFLFDVQTVYGMTISSKDFKIRFDKPILTHELPEVFLAVEW